MLEENPYPIKAVLFLLTNPLVSYTNSEEVYRAFMKVDFIAGADIFPTPTTAIADIVLPAAWGAEMEMAKRNMGRFLNKEIAPIANRGDQQGPFTRDEKVILVRKAGRSCKTGIKIF